VSCFHRRLDYVLIDYIGSLHEAAQNDLNGAGPCLFHFKADTMYGEPVERSDYRVGTYGWSVAERLGFGGRSYSIFEANNKTDQYHITKLF
jgi:hypothetical protein